MRATVNGYFNGKRTYLSEIKKRQYATLGSLLSFFILSSVMRHNCPIFEQITRHRSEVAQPQCEVAQPQCEVAQPRSEVAQPQCKVAQPQVKVAQPQPKVAQPRLKVTPLTEILFQQPYLIPCSFFIRSISGARSSRTVPFHALTPAM